MLMRCLFDNDTLIGRNLKQNVTEKTDNTESYLSNFLPVYNWLLTASGNHGSMFLSDTKELNNPDLGTVLPTAVTVGDSENVDTVYNTPVDAIPVVPTETMDRGGESSPNAQRAPEEQPKENEKRGCCKSGGGCCDACYCPRTNTTFIYIDTGSSSGDGGCCFNFCKGVLDGFNQMICCPVETVKSCATNPPCHLTDCCCLFQPVEGSLAEPLSGIAEVSKEASCCVECLNCCCMILAA